MSEPVCVDRDIFNRDKVLGVGLSSSFADAYAKRYGEEVGLIPCADGDTKTSDWQPGMPLFDHAVMQTKLAMRSSALGGILWHQGEGNCNPAGIPVYHEQFMTMINAMKKELGVGDIPLILGEIGQFFKLRVERTDEEVDAINGILRGLAKEIPNAGIASSEGLESRGDNIHFNAPALREFGLRYFEEYRKIREGNI